MAIHPEPCRLVTVSCCGHAMCWSLRRQLICQFARVPTHRQPSLVLAAAKADGGVSSASAQSLVPPPPFPDRSLDPSQRILLPPLRDCRLYLSLTNGLEVLPLAQAHGLPVAFLRLQSTTCEQQDLERLLSQLDADLLLHLALGRCCVVADLGSRNKKRGAPRALWMGLEFARYALTRLWLERPSQAFLRGINATADFERRVQSLSKSTKKRLRYYKRYIPPGGLQEIQLIGAYRATQHDDDDDFYRQTVWSSELVPRCSSDSLQRPGSASSSSGDSTCNGGRSRQPCSSSDGDSESGPARSSDSGSSQSHPLVVMAAAQAAAAAAALGPGECEVLLSGDLRTAVYRLLGLHLFVGGVSHAVLQRLEAEDAAAASECEG